MELNKKILCIISRQFPGGNANSICMDILLEKFKENGCHIDYLCAKNNVYDKDISCYEYGNIIKYDTYKTRFVKKIRRIVKTDEFDKIPFLLRKISSFFNSVKRKIFRSKYIGIESENLRNIIKLVQKTRNNYDIIISVCSPIDSHIIASKLLNIYKNAKWYPVYFDPFIRYSLYSKIGTKSRLKFSEKLLENSEKIFLVKGIMEEHKRYLYNPPFENKVVEIHLPNLMDRTCDKIEANDNQKCKIKNQSESIVNEKKEKITMAYAGIFYKKIRNPKKMIKVLSEISEDDYQLIFMSKYCENEFKKQQKINPKFNPKMLGIVDREKCLKILNNADILINLGNFVINQTPSKVFEYIGMGKPIINFYFDENDTSLFYLKKYPLCFNFNLNNYTKETINALSHFCKQNKNKQLTFKESIKDLEDITADKISNMFYGEIVEIIDY